VKTLIGFGFAIGTLLSLAAVTSASAAEPTVVAPVPDAGIEVIVVTAKRPVAQAVDAAQPIHDLIVTAKRVVKAPDRTPPTMAIEMPKLKFTVAELPVIRL
jgi:hypothetical protein